VVVEQGTAARRRHRARVPRARCDLAAGRRPQGQAPAVDRQGQGGRAAPAQTETEAAVGQRIGRERGGGMTTVLPAPSSSGEVVDPRTYARTQSASATG